MAPGAGDQPRHGRYHGRVVVVTGAAQGIGKASALRMAAEGASVVLVDRATGPCETVRDEITARGGQALLVATDLERLEGAQAVVQATLQAHGRIDVSVHNVGGTIWAKPFWEYEPEQIEREINRSLWPTLWCCREMAALMKRQGQGTIVNVGSIATRGIHRVPYAAAKGGVHAMTVAMAMELAEFGVRVNCVSPGAIDNGTRIVPRNPEPLSPAETAWMQAIYTQSMRDTPMNRLGTPDEVAAAIAFLGSDDAAYVTGQVMYVAGGAIG